MSPKDQLVIFTLDDQRYAIRLSAVERVVRMVEITPLPNAPNAILGAINVQGEVVPVYNVRKRVNLPEREARLNDQLIIARTAKRKVVVIADAIRGIAEYPDSKVVSSETILPGLPFLEGVVKLEDGMIFIHDLDRFLTLEEEKELVNSMNME